MDPTDTRHSRVAGLVPVLAILAVLASAACAGTAGNTGDGTFDGPTVLEVDNQSTSLMTIYVQRVGGQRRRLGQANSLTTTHLTIPGTLIFGITPLRFQADPVGAGRTPFSNEISVSPGDTVVLVIPNR